MQYMDDETVIALPEGVQSVYTKDDTPRWTDDQRQMFEYWGKHVAKVVRQESPTAQFSNWAGLRGLNLTPQQLQVFAAWGAKIAYDVAKGKTLPTVGSIWGSNIDLVGSVLRIEMFSTLSTEQLIKGLVPRVNGPQWMEYFFEDPENIGRVLEGVPNIRYEGDLNNPVNWDKRHVMIGEHKSGQLMSMATGGTLSDAIAFQVDPLHANAADRLLKEGGFPIQMAQEDELAFLGKEGDMYHGIRRAVFHQSVEWLRDKFLSRESDAFTTLLIVPATLPDLQRVCDKYSDKLKVWWAIEEIAKLAYPHRRA